MGPPVSADGGRFSLLREVDGRPSSPRRRVYVADPKRDATAVRKVSADRFGSGGGGIRVAWRERRLAATVMWSSYSLAVIRLVPGAKGAT